MRLTATLTAINSNRDRAGNCYWAFRFVDHETGKVVQGCITGGESNINCIRRYYNPNIDGWDSSIQCLIQSYGIREFNRLTKDWKYAGCNPEDLANFIRQELAVVSEREA